VAYLEDARTGSQAQRTAHVLTGSRSVGIPPGVWQPLAIIVVFLASWEMAVSAGALSALFFPPPSVIALTLVRLTANGVLPAHMAATFSRLVVGLAIGGMIGLLLGLWMGWSEQVRRVLDPLVAALHPVPKTAMLPVIMIIFGIGESSKIVIVVIAAFFPMLINSMAGVRQINPIHFEVARSFQATPWRVFTRVVLPGSLPMVLAGARIALNVSLLLTIGVEMVAAHQGLGALIWLAWETLRTEQLYAGLTVAAMLGVGFNRLILALTAHFVPWQPPRGY
jgi:ABC-type nitrate/sulfonate/bicarbonate transport system permease component